MPATGKRWLLPLSLTVSLALALAQPAYSQQKQSRLIKDLDKTEYRIADLQEKVDNINNSIRTEEEAIMNLEVQLQFKMESMVVKKKLIQEKLRDLVVFTTPERLNFLITTDDFDTISRSEAVVSRMLRRDMMDYGMLEQESKKIRETREFISLEKMKLEQDRKNYAVYLEDLKKARDKRKSILDRVKSTSLGYTALVKRMQKGGEEIGFFAGGSSKLQKMSSSKYRELLEDLVTPVKGEIIKTFGRVWDSRIKNWIYNKGVTLVADQGTQVHAVDDGTVSFSGWIMGYGKVVIIKHKNSLFSVYAHLARSMFNAGDTVSKNTVLGLVGDTGSVDQPSLYFELRQARNNIDPTPLFY